MGMTIEIAGDLERLLKTEAGKAGVAPEEYTSRLLRNSLLKGKPNAPVLSQEEARLLEVINQGLSAVEMDRYAGLVRKRQSETISGPEVEELRDLTERLEELGVLRAESLAKLARIRGVPMDVLMEQLQLQPPDVL